MNFKKLLSKDLKLLIAKKVHYRTGKYIDEVLQKQKIVEDKIWLLNFDGKDSFDFDLDEGIKIRLYNDSILSRLIYNGFEKEEISFLKKALRKGDYFLDIGANIGLFSLYASKIVGDKGGVFAFEPSPKTYERLVENIQLNGFSNVKGINKGLSNKQGILELKVSENGFDAWNSFANIDSAELQKSIVVPVTTLDDFLIQEDIIKNKVSFVKIDVEGWEKFVIEGGRDFLQKNSPTLMVEFTESNVFRAGYTVYELYDLMNNLGYRWFRYVGEKLVEEGKKLHYPYDNLIATKDISRLEASISL